MVSTELKYQTHDTKDLIKRNTRWPGCPAEELFLADVY